MKGEKKNEGNVIFCNEKENAMKNRIFNVLCVKKQWSHNKYSLVCKSKSQRNAYSKGKNHKIHKVKDNKKS